MANCMRHRHSVALRIASSNVIDTSHTSESVAHATLIGPNPIVRYLVSAES